MIFFFQHAERTFHGVDGSVTHHDTGILHVPLDRHGINILRPHMPQLKEAELCECKGVYCGWPFYMAIQSKLR